jgi:hypothetical protein
MHLRPGTTSLGILTTRLRGLLPRGPGIQITAERATYLAQLEAWWESSWSWEFASVVGISLSQYLVLYWLLCAKLQPM